MPSATVVVHQVELTDPDDSIFINTLCFDEHGEIVETDVYDWVIEVRGEGQLIVYPPDDEGEFIIDIKDPVTRAKFLELQPVGVDV